MTFNVRIHSTIENGKPLKAVASVTMDGMYAVHNVRVIQTEKGMDICFFLPKKWSKRVNC